MRNGFPNQSRRRLVCAAIALPAGVLLGRNATAQDKLDPSSPTAVALSYTDDATQSIRSSADQTCANCLHYTGEAGAEWGPCAIFLGSLVAHDGWCAGWVPKS